MRNELRGELRLILTPKLLHYLAVLQMPILDLVQALKNEIETNPALEEVEPESEEVITIDLFKDELETYLPKKDEEEINILENIPALPENIFNYLEREIKIKFQDPELKIALAILYDLDHEGFIHTKEEEFAAQLEVDVGLIKKIRARLQRIDPIGCFSYTTIEALRVQLESDGYGPDSIEWQTLSRISESEDFDLEDIDPAIMKHLSKYHPKPGLKYSSEIPQYIMPDMIVRWQENQLLAFLNEEPLPKVRIRREIIDILKSPKSFTTDEVSFAKEKFRLAKNLLISINDRNKTLKNLLNIIIADQKDFFQKGEEYIKPLTMKHVAERLNLSISTISRAVSGKYLESPRGIMELKKFFISGTMPKLKKRIKKRIGELIANEDYEHQLSDSSIAKILDKEGYEISRRTIAKYRSELGYDIKGKRKKRNRTQI